MSHWLFAYSSFYRSKQDGGLCFLVGNPKYIILHNLQWYHFSPSLLLLGMDSNSKMVGTDFIHTCSPSEDFHSSQAAFPIFNKERNSLNYGSGRICSPVLRTTCYFAYSKRDRSVEWDSLQWDHQYLDSWFSFFCAQDLNLALFIILNFHLSTFGLFLRKKM